MVSTFGIDEQQIQATDEADRFKRPVTVAVFGCLISLAIVAIIFMRSGGPNRNDSGVIGIIAFGVIACVISCGYACIGAHYSRKLAHRVLTIVGSILALGGVAYLVYMLLAYAP